MKKHVFIFLLICCYLTSFSQTVKVHSSELLGVGINVMPDELGYVQMTQEAYEQFLEGNLISTPLKNSSNLEIEPTLFDGFPTTFNGSSDKNAIYCNLDGDPELEIIYTGTQQLHAYNTDGSVVDGWPTQTMNDYIEKSLSLGDITGDGIPEIVVATRLSSGWLYAFDLSGNVIENFPIHHGFNGGSPTLYDIDGDNKMEILISKRIYPTGEIYIYNEDGTVLPGWPQALPYIPTGSISVADIDNDDQVEIIAAYYDGLKVFETDGTEVFHFILPADVHISYSSPVIANIDCLPGKEIAFASLSYGSQPPAVYVLNNDGTIYPNWPQSTTWNMYAHVSIADIDDNGTLDIFCGDQILGASNYYIYGWDKDGNNLTGFPIETTWAINSQLLIADIDNDQHLEIISDDNVTYSGNTGYYHAYNHDGTPTDGWPLEVTNGGTFYKTPTIFDVDNDGNLDFMGASGVVAPYETSPHLWKLNVPVPDPALMPLTTSQFNLQRTGEYLLDNCAVAVEEIIVSAEGGVNAITTPDGTLQMLAEVLPENATNQSVTWSISAGTNFGEISQEGILTAINDGTVTVRATANDGSGVFGELDIEISNQTMTISSHEHTFSIYPNPSNGIFIIESTHNIESLEITNITGKTILTRGHVPLNDPLHLQINIPLTMGHAPLKGVYFLKLITNNKTIIKKIIIN